MGWVALRRDAVPAAECRPAGARTARTRGTDPTAAFGGPCARLPASLAAALVDLGIAVLIHRIAANFGRRHDGTHARPPLTARTRDGPGRANANAIGARR